MKHTSIVLAVTAVTLAIPATAAITTYGSRATFNGAAGPTAVETFNSCGGTSSLGNNFVLSASNPGPCASIAAGISFAPDSGFDLYIAGPGQSANVTTALGVDFPPSGNNHIRFTGGSLSFGADFNQNFGGGAQRGTPVLFTLDALDLMGNLLATFNFSVPSGTSAFFGLTSDTALGGVDVRQQEGGFAVLDDVAFNALGAVPEPASWALLISGFGLTGAAMRRRSRNTVLA